jgi:hypothetical protein
LALVAVVAETEALLSLAPLHLPVAAAVVAGLMPVVLAVLAVVVALIVRLVALATRHQRARAKAMLVQHLPAPVVAVAALAPQGAERMVVQAALPLCIVH